MQALPGKEAISAAMTARNYLESFFVFTVGVK